jgi:hypothetical protein
MATVIASEAASNVLFTETSVKIGVEPELTFDSDVSGPGFVA